MISSSIKKNITQADFFNFFLTIFLYKYQIKVYKTIYKNLSCKIVYFLFNDLIVKNIYLEFCI